jgi:hypothetical protein
MAERERSEARFSESIDQLIGAIRALLLGHWSLLRAELGAIARDVVITLIGAAAIVSLIVTALLGLLIALFLILGEGLFGSQLWGAAQMTLLLLSLAAAIASSILRIPTGRRRRALVLGALAGVGALLLTLLPLAWEPGPASLIYCSGCATLRRSASLIVSCHSRAKRSCAQRRKRWKIFVRRHSEALPLRWGRRSGVPTLRLGHSVAASRALLRR